MSKKEEKQEESQEEMEVIDAAGVSEVEVEATEIGNLKAEFSEMEGKFLRARAEIANMSNRNKNERELLARYRSQGLGKKILPSIDSLERAMAIEVPDEQGESLKKDISMVLESTTVALKEEGIEEILAMGETFDPNLYRVVQTAPASEETPADIIAKVLQEGYKLQDRVLRPSMVIVT